MPQTIGYLGSYFSPASPAIGRFTVDEASGSLSLPVPCLDIPESKYLALNGSGLLASIVRRGDRAGVSIADLAGGAPHILAELLPEKSAASHIAFSGELLYTANFHEGTVLVYRWSGGLLSLERRLSIAPGAGCHQTLFHEGLMLVPCMERDEIRIFDKLNRFTQFDAICFPTGSGPRHGVFNASHTRLFVAAEKSCRLFSFLIKETTFTFIGSVPLLPPELLAGSTAAAVRLSADERFLYVSIRGANRIAVFSTDGDLPRLLQLAPCSGDHPRDIALTPGGAYLIAANRFSGELVSFPVDRETGLLGGAVSRVDAPQAVAIVLEHGKDDKFGTV